MDSRDTEAIFHIRKARSILKGTDPGSPSSPEPSGAMFNRRIQVHPVECGECGDLGVHVDDYGRWPCPNAAMSDNDPPDPYRCPSCGQVPAVTYAGTAPICGDCLTPLWED